MTGVALPAAVLSLLPATPPGLVVPRPAPSVAGLLRLTVADLFPDGVVDEEAALGCLAGVLLLRDAYDRSHDVCQDLDTAEGAYWHGIAHRREPDPGNAKYWMRAVGRHPIHETLARDVIASGSGAGPSSAADPARVVVAGRWDACRFVDACAAPRMAPGVRTTLEAWQFHEARLLLAHGAAVAVGRGA